MTLSCNEGSIRLRPAWPWRARRDRIVPEEAEQYWNIFLCPSSCLAALPLFVRPMMTIQELFLKIFCLSNQSLHHCLEVDFHDEEDGSPNKCSSCGWPDRISFLWFCFGLWSACKITCIHPFLTHILRTAFLRLPARCFSNSWPTCFSHEKFWPMSENCLCSRIYLVSNRL